MTPEEFKEAMLKIYPPGIDVCEEAAHCKADQLLCEVLRSLGYGAGIDIFDNATQWYA